MSIFYFARHGETDWNADGRLCGRADVPLSVVGKRQAELLARRLQPIPFVALYSSPLRRALETAAIIGRAIRQQPIVDPRLVELSYGKWEGKTYEESRNLSPQIYRAWELDPASVAPPEGESGEQLVDRLKPFMDELPRRHLDGNVAVICHRTVCRLSACHLMRIPLREYRKRVPMDNGALNIFEWRKGQWIVLGINDTTHLSASLPETATTS